MQHYLRDEDVGQLIGGWIAFDEAVIDEAVIHACEHAISIQDLDLKMTLGLIHAVLAE